MESCVQVRERCGNKPSLSVTAALSKHLQHLHADDVVITSPPCEEVGVYVLGTRSEGERDGSCEGLQLLVAERESCHQL